MRLSCRFGIHAAKEHRVWNDGYYFSSCAHCDRRLVRTPSSKWKTVPDGYKVVWRPRTEHDVVWPSHLL